MSIAPKKVGNVTIIDRTKPFDGACEICGKVEDLRPYGPNNEWICFSCGSKDNETTEKQMAKYLGLE